MDSSAQQPFTVAQVARELNTPAWNVRRWADYHSAHLSPHVPGDPRLFTQKDVDTLREVQQLRAAGMTAGQVNKELDQKKIGEIVPAEQVETLPAVQEEHDTGAATHVQIQILFDQLADLRRRQRDGAIMFAAGSLFTAIFFLIILILIRLFGS